MSAPPTMEEVTPRPPATAKAQPPVNLRRDSTAEQSDKEFLRREESNDRNRSRATADYSDPGTRPSAPPSPYGPGVINPPAPLDAPSADFPVLFAGTPFANAPLSVQQETLRRAQSYLADRGYYRDVVDGLPGPATEEAILSYQHSNRLTLTGRLDLQTLNELRLLPRGNGDGGLQFGIELRIPHHVFRGVWVDRR